MKNKIVCTDYKGKHFVLTDEDRVDDEWDTLNNYIDIDKLLSDDGLLKNYLTDCIYYGIPSYIGSDEELKKRIEELENGLTLI